MDDEKRIGEYLSEIERIHAALAGRSWQFGDVVHGINDIELRRSDIASLLERLRAAEARAAEAEAVIAEAPHAPDCATRQGKPGEWQCIDCWKSRYRAGADHE